MIHNLDWQDVKETNIHGQVSIKREVYIFLRKKAKINSKEETVAIMRPLLSLSLI